MKHTGKLLHAAAGMAFALMASGAAYAEEDKAPTTDRPTHYEGIPVDKICAPDPLPSGQHSGPPAMSLSQQDSQNGNQFYGSAMGNRQFLLFGDTNHYDHRISDYFYSHDNIDRLSAQGVKHIFIEMGPQNQYIIDDLVSGKMTDDDFAKINKGGIWDHNNKSDYEQDLHAAQGILYAAAKGIKIHAVDLKGHTSVTKADREELYKFIKDRSRTFAALCPQNDSMTMAFIQAYHGKRQAYLQHYAPIFNELMATRYDDTERAALIKSIAGNERSAVFYGSGHYDGPKSMPALLGPENSVQIYIFPDARQVEGQYAQGEFTGVDFGHIVSENKVYQLGTVTFDGLNQNQSAKPQAAKPSI
ncbi:MAG: hypothetical protein H6867_10965 [Rhodospirillales bacterium]|nr:hypothetical protein [Rhodospirillales bacterium]MCB9996649.1 hypothetical protein [Rhodospirillales bacterium]